MVGWWHRGGQPEEVGRAYLRAAREGWLREETGGVWRTGEAWEPRRRARRGEENEPRGEAANGERGGEEVINRRGEVTKDER